MNLDILIKYLIWIVFFAITLTAMYLIFKRTGIL
jgi:hypothetical protein